MLACLINRCKTAVVTFTAHRQPKDFRNDRAEAKVILPAFVSV
jgi:hypothetical protein